MIDQMRDVQERAVEDDSQVFNLEDFARSSWKEEYAEENQNSVLCMQSLKHPSGDVDVQLDI